MSGGIEDEETLKDRFNSITSAQERSRVALFSMLFVSLAILAAVWNAYMSNLRSFAQNSDKNMYATYEMDKPDFEKSGTRKLQEELIGQWVKSGFISISLLGITLSVGDAPLLGSLALLITCLWFYFCIRRENINIGMVILDTLKIYGPDSSRRDLRKLWRVYHAINGSTVFTRVVHTDQPIASIDTAPKFTLDKSPYWRFNIVSFFYFIPVIVCAMSLGFDCASVFFVKYRSPFRIYDHKHSTLFMVLESEDIWWIAFEWSTSAACLIWLCSLCVKSWNFAMATESVLLDLLKTINPNEEHEAGGSDDAVG